MITAAGGKLTTARLMGAQIVDAVAEQLRDRDHVRGLPESVTASAAISGGDPGEVFRAQQAVAGAPVPPEVRGGGCADTAATPPIWPAPRSSMPYTARWR
jgi:glycerol-3-phosphate dehydrogenase